MIANRFPRVLAQTISLALVALVVGLPRAASADTADSSADSLYQALSRLPLDSLAANQYLWLQAEHERRQRLAPTRQATGPRRFSSAWDKPQQPGSATVDSAPRQISLSGPRFGVTFLSDGIVEKLEDEDISVSSLVTQFGWQVEKRFYSSENGLMGVTQWVMLVGGLEQGVVLPSVSWLVGIRTTNGVEFGVGPNVTPVGAALALAVGVTHRTGALNFPVNLVVVPSKSGVRVGLIAGFNMRQ